MILRYFRAHEFHCPCGECEPCSVKMDKDVLSMLDFARHRTTQLTQQYLGHSEGVPFALNSAIRCPAHNADVGGLEDSSHLKGYAVDVATPDSRSRFFILKALMDAGFNRIGVYKDFIHADNDPDLPPGVTWHSS